MAKALILMSVLLLAWTWSLNGDQVPDGKDVDNQLNNTAAPADVDGPGVNATEFNSTVVCQLDPATGPCKAFVDRYFYNSTSKSCEIFVYGGCMGNQNNFKNETVCMEKCHTEEKELPKEN